MTRREAVRQTHQENTLRQLGFTVAESEQLRRISLTLHRWYEHECNGNIERDGDNGDGKPFWSIPDIGKHRAYPIPDRERGAERRLKAIINTRNARLHVKNATRDVLGPKTTDVSAYLQGDPRGAVLYIIRPGDVPEGKDVNGYYSRGIVVY